MKSKDNYWDIQCKGITKSFGGVVALAEVDFECKYGEIHALLGENGAGKSTLVKILSGALKEDSGGIYINEKKVILNSVKNALSEGICAVFQELSLLPDLSISENLMYGREKRVLGIIDSKANNRFVHQIFDNYNIQGINSETKVRDLSISTQQVIEIVKALSRKPKILILDEATAALTREATLWLFEHLQNISRQGVSVIFISHRINEVIEIADRITVFRNGKNVSSGLTNEYSESSLILNMLGESMTDELMIAPPNCQDKIALEITNFNLGNKLKDINLFIKKGEILGLGGLQGQGQYDLLLSLIGWNRPSGEIKLFGGILKIKSTRDALDNGIILIPQDRRVEGLMMRQSLRENLVLPSLKDIVKYGWILINAEMEKSFSIGERFKIKTPSLENEVNTLSGGNQQKVLVGKLLSRNVKVLLLADVTRGIDVGTRADVYKLIYELARSGIAIILYSSDSNELVRLCHRVAVMHDRKISTILTGSNINEENLIRAAFGLPNNEH